MFLVKWKLLDIGLKIITSSEIKSLRLRIWGTI